MGGKSTLPSPPFLHHSEAGGTVPPTSPLGLILFYIHLGRMARKKQRVLTLTGSGSAKVLKQVSFFQFFGSISEKRTARKIAIPL